MEPLNLGIVGAGVMGESHAQAIVDGDLTALACVVDLDEGRARRVASAMGTDAYGSLDAALADSAAEAFVVAVPDKHHVDPTVQILNTGRHVFLEKPMAATLEEARVIAAAAESSSGRVTVAHILRHDARFAGAANAVADGLVGEPLHVRGWRNVGTHIAKINGGRSPIWMYQGVHDIDLAQWISGQRIVNVYARTVEKLLSERGIPGVDAVIVSYEFGNGAIGTLEISWALPTNMPAGLYAGFELVGSTGTVAIDTHAQGLAIVGEMGHQLPDTVHLPTINGRLDGDLARELAAFARAIRTGSDFEMPLVDAMSAVAVLDAIERSVNSGAPEDVEQL